MRDWTKTLRPASYKGVGFFVDDEGGKGGRHVASHNYVKAESHATEDMGRRQRDYHVAAYLASDDADTAARDFMELCSEAGAGMLVLPILGTVRVRCTTCHLKAVSAKLGRVELELEFIEAGADDSTLSPPAPIGDRLAASALAEMPAASSTRLDGLDETTRQGALTGRLDPAGAAGAGWSLPASTDYQGTETDAAARQAAFAALYGSP